MRNNTLALAFRFLRTCLSPNGASYKWEEPHTYWEIRFHWDERIHYAWIRHYIQFNRHDIIISASSIHTQLHERRSKCIRQMVRLLANVMYSVQNFDHRHDEFKWTRSEYETRFSRHESTSTHQVNSGFMKKMETFKTK